MVFRLKYLVMGCMLALLLNFAYLWNRNLLEVSILPNVMEQYTSGKIMDRILQNYQQGSDINTGNSELDPSSINDQTPPPTEYKTSASVNGKSQEMTVEPEEEETNFETYDIVDTQENFLDTQQDPVVLNGDNSHTQQDYIAANEDILNALESPTAINEDYLNIEQYSIGANGDFSKIDKLQEEPSYRYLPPATSGLDQSVLGAEFTANHTLLESLGLPQTSFFNLTKDTVKDFVFLTAADTSHFVEITDAIASVQKHFPGYDIHFYDIGLEEEEVMQAKTWCRVTLHKPFDFSPFPRHIGQKYYKCWKFMIIQEMLQQYGAVFWIDASFRSREPMDQWEDVFNLAVQNGGIVTTTHTNMAYLTNFAYTDPVMYQYIPTQIELQKAIKQICSCAILIYNTEAVYKNILWWMYLCSLEKRCCPPVTYDQVVTEEDKTKPDVFQQHRHDQSALNLLLTNYFSYNISNFVPPKIHHKITREPTSEFVVQTC